MALLQISEPGLSAAPHQRRLAAGIDLGSLICNKAMLDSS
ncbi:hypothetical protein L245_24005 [Salmonella enterica subsp. enterica serovar Worthington str. BCH-4719]|nr:hypothetical protein L245_24005 [Salmonella enterica subsp. enterica serovar Worthington str. BCH-4719]